MKKIGEHLFYWGAEEIRTAFIDSHYTHSKKYGTIAIKPIPRCQIVYNEQKNMYEVWTDEE